MKPADPAALAARLSALPVAVESAFALSFGVAALDYPGGWRPSGELHLGGLGCLAGGECVAFDEASQARFARTAAAAALGWRATVAEVVAAADASGGASEEARWARAAIEAAVLDLALRQAGQSLGDLAGVGDQAVVEIDHVVSFAAVDDPAARVTELAAITPGVRFKVDVDPRWSEPAIAALVATDRVAILDFKGRGDAALAARLGQHFPSALLEDPPAGAELPPARVVIDQSLVDGADVARAIAAGHGLNLKPARMGGYLALLSALAAAQAARGPVYIGGMFEVGVGRRQARALAALFTAAAPNDLAPLRSVERPAGAPRLAVRLDRPGLGS